MPRTRRSDCSGPGIRRRRRGRGFEYLDDAAGRRITDAPTLDRLRELAIPPAWKDVWICSDPLGHLQATGVDAAGRKQYLYHPAWRERREQHKFDHVVDFARGLPKLRRRVDDDLDREGLDRERVLAAAVRLLDRGMFRVGGEEYAETNETYGLATIERRHVRISGDEIVFDYDAKGGLRRVVTLVEPDVQPVIEALRRRRTGTELLAYRNGRGWADVRSDDINEYLKEIAGEEATAKDFRTWNGTVLAAVALASMLPVPDSQATRKRKITEAVKGVAFVLGNTPAVSRRSYINPKVIERYEEGATIAPTLKRLGKTADIRDPEVQHTVERAVLRLVA